MRCPWFATILQNFEIQYASLNFCKDKCIVISSLTPLHACSISGLPS
jgi:hypothetical protein